jgi:hypothetical protein
MLTRAGGRFEEENMTRLARKKSERQRKSAFADQFAVRANDATEWRCE